MLELHSPDIEIVNTNERITIDLMKQGVNFLTSHEINDELVPDTVSLLYKFLNIQTRMPHNLYKYFAAAYYIISRHPFAFPMHQKKSDFCEKFRMQESSLEYCVERIANTIGLIRMLDDMNFPYFMNPDGDLCYKMIKAIVKKEVDKAMMSFLLYHQPINSQILTEDLTCDLIFKHNAFPEELLRQLYEIVHPMVEEEFRDHKRYVKLQNRVFI